MCCLLYVCLLVCRPFPLLATQHNMSGKKKNARMKEKSFWERMAHYKEGVAEIDFDLLECTADASGELKVRVVLDSRVTTKVESMRGGWMHNAVFTVRRNENGTYTVFDGNHRYHGIRRLRNAGGAASAKFPAGWKVRSATRA